MWSKDLIKEGKDNKEKDAFQRKHISREMFLAYKRRGIKVYNL